MEQTSVFVASIIVTRGRVSNAKSPANHRGEWLLLQNSWFKIHEEGQGHFIYGGAATHLLVVISLFRRWNGIRMGAGRKFEPICGNNRRSHGAGPCGEPRPPSSLYRHTGL